VSQNDGDMNDPVEEEALEIEEPQRREQSAEFAVAESAGTEAEMRRAMDPANQSLGDALRLSYRILQVVIAGLAIVFVFSGFQTVAENSTGVRTLFGAIEGKGDDAQLEPGLHPFWPYPIGEIVTVPLRRHVRVDHAFWPRLASDQMTIDQATDAASVNTPIRPGGDGSLMLRNGDLAHARIEAEYEIEDAVAFLGQFTAEQADEVVKLSLERGAVQVAALSTLTIFLDEREQATSGIKTAAQAMLDKIGTGIRLVSVSVPDRIAPLAVRKAVEGVQQARERAKITLEVARSDAATMIAQAVGPTAYGDLVGLINDYEQELSRGDTDAAEEVLSALNHRFEADDISGDAAQIIRQARAYHSMIESTLGNDARRLAGLVPAFEENPEQLVRQLWLDVYKQVLNNPEAEVFSMPPGIGGLALSISSSREISTLRRDAAVERAKAASSAGLFTNDGVWQLGSRQISIDKAGRRLDRGATGGFGRKEQ
jgi:regulator of protease activity HflC (stomatin/prohibitin superfamily)